MKRRKLSLALVLALGIGLLAIPFASAQFAGGDADNNEDESDFGGGDAGNNEDESDFGGGDAGNNEDAETQEEDDPAPRDRRRRAAIFSLDPEPDVSLSAQLSEESITLTDSVTVTGDLENDDVSDEEIDISLNETLEATAVTDAEGAFQEDITPGEAGSYVVLVEHDSDAEPVELDLDVTTDAVRIESITAENLVEGEPVEVCVQTTMESEVTLFHNDEEFDTATGELVCFEPVAQEGDNTFRAVATAEGETDEAEITRTAEPAEPDEEQPFPEAPTADFVQAPTALLAAIAALIAFVGGAIMLFVRGRGGLKDS